MWWLVVTISVALIASGLWLLIRDVRVTRSSVQRAFTAMTAASARKAPAAEVTITAAPPVRSGAPVASPVSAISSPALEALQRTVVGIAEEAADIGESATRQPKLEQQWRQSIGQQELAVIAVNRLLGAVGVNVSPGGEAGWSLRNQGYGSYRRVTLNAKSLAWLRMEMGQDGALGMKSRAHAPEHAMLNRALRVTRWPIPETDVADALAECLQPIAEFAAWQSTEPQALATELKLPATTVVAPPPPALAATIVDPLHGAAVALVNGAFVDVGTRLVPRSAHELPQAPAANQNAFGVEVEGRPIALLMLERHPDAVDISVGVSDPADIALAQRQRIATRQLTAHALAEAIATCAWPAIASYRARASAA